MDPETVTAKRFIIDHMIANNLKLHKIEITKLMLKAFWGVHSLYKIRLEEQKNYIFLIEREKQALQISDDIEKLKTSSKADREMMVDEFVECARLAEEKNDISFVIKGNRLKRKSDKTKEDISRSYC